MAQRRELVGTAGQGRTGIAVLRLSKRMMDEGCGTWSQMPGSIWFCFDGAPALAGRLLPLPFGCACGVGPERCSSLMAKEMALDLSRASSMPPRSRRKAAADEAHISVSSS